MKRICENCKHWTSWPKRDCIGSCRRYPPQWTGGSDTTNLFNWTFPLTGTHSFCGEFKSKKSTRISMDEQLKDYMLR